MDIDNRRRHSLHKRTGPWIVKRSRIDYVQGLDKNLRENLQRGDASWIRSLCPTTHQESLSVLRSTGVLNHVEGLQALDGSITEVIESVESGRRVSSAACASRPKSAQTDMDRSAALGSITKFRSPDLTAKHHPSSAAESARSLLSLHTSCGLPPDVFNTSLTPNNCSTAMLTFGVLTHELGMGPQLKGQNKTYDLAYDTVLVDHDE
ncbi:hypothetical protein EDB92DRAFT_1814770 [Lactarius akahatsu]|uniref:Uncharacterized protein n=1 Tax=Lactarius akahatsu TaxID=416441 RepID=A0AAD4LNR0_9AGAM|nr:hypothetical protein EDB92DRAFT_1814770 [Lactarius akahatsu]